MKKRMLSIVLAVVLLVSSFAVLQASALTDTVSLLYARVVSVPRPSGDQVNNYYKAEGFIEVNNLAYDKTVTVVYARASSYEALYYGEPTWQETEATYHANTINNREAWKFETETVNTGYRGYSYYRFAIKYEVNGQTYWDNNNGQDYWMYSGKVSDPYPYNALGSAGVALNGSNTYSSNRLTCSLMVKNLAYNKDVKVRYTTDNWATYSDVSASYQRTAGPDGIEYWTAQTPYIASGTTVEYAISYTVNGVTYWDNNFNSNYSAIIP